MGLEQAKIEAFVILSEKEYLVSANINDLDSLTIAKTIDGGKSWFAYRNGYKPTYEKNIPTDMKVDPFNPDIIYAAGPGLHVAKSINKGKSWKLISGDWALSGPIKFIHIGESYIWVGGGNTIFEPSLLKIDKEDYTRTYITPYGTPYFVTDMVLKNRNSNDLLIAVAGIVRKSKDGGKNWETVLIEVGVFTLIHSASNPKIVYAGGFKANGLPYFFAATGNFGESWEFVRWINK